MDSKHLFSKASFLPIVVAIIHLAMARSIGLSDLTGSSKILLWTGIIFGVFFFPLVPAFFYIVLVICPKETAEELRRYKGPRSTYLLLMFDADNCREMS